MEGQVLQVGKENAELMWSLGQIWNERGRKFGESKVGPTKKKNKWDLILWLTSSQAGNSIKLEYDLGLWETL